MEKIENIVELEKKATELLESIQAIKYSKKIIPHNIQFSDIENLISALSLLAVSTTISKEQVEMNNLTVLPNATDSLWKIRQYLLLEDDNEYSIQRLKEYRKETQIAENK
jgi:hypothetical protein